MTRMLIPALYFSSALLCLTVQSVLSSSEVTSTLVSKSVKLRRLGHHHTSFPNSGSSGGTGGSGGYWRGTGSGRDGSGSGSGSSSSGGS
eukprot:CAMPEP_0198268486 /NCGR_PEP_ID=MMETSP1447-20131203/37373_1 /TAXON_ID=420782 /ORGANISM="Chaetoceros dichaeta, Strain CCMP1751" /LENGTH=88 /DNA_ID=CAMNT_0043959549 /DNA_START=217 /DNA_END=480 /DNA_ORIENTATION=+